MEEIVDRNLINIHMYMSINKIINKIIANQR